MIGAAADGGPSEGGERSTLAEKFFAAALLLGGATIIFVILSPTSGPGGLSVFNAVVLLFLALSGASIWAAWALWSGHPLGPKAALFLFALQVPVFSIGGVTYEFFTGASVHPRVVFASGIDLAFWVGGSFALWLGSTGGVEHLGVNLLALAACGYLLWAD